MIDLSARSKARVWIGTIGGTLLCVLVALLVDSFNFANLDQAQLRRAITVNIWLPIFLAGPLLFLLLRKIRQLALARDAMAVLASTDSLTAVLNRGAFNMLVDAYLTQARTPETPADGTLLIIDADHFKSINDGYGHQTGDEALRLIASNIQGALRTADLVGRIGGEEFGVFLPGTSKFQATQIAERIRSLIETAPFPSAESPELSVSIGGVSFTNENDYERLFKIADGCLYEAKNSGRNRVRLKNYAGQPAAA